MYGVYDAVKRQALQPDLTGTDQCGQKQALAEEYVLRAADHLHIERARFLERHERARRHAQDFACGQLAVNQSACSPQKHLPGIREYCSTALWQSRQHARERKER